MQVQQVQKALLVLLLGLVLNLVLREVLELQ